MQRPPSDSISSSTYSPALVLARLARLRKEMTSAGWDGYFVPSADPHLSEYLPDRWKRREYLSGFTGSLGDLLVGQTGAWLWTDSRYFLQADEQLAGTGITLCRLGIAGAPTLETVIDEHFPRMTVAVDPHTILVRDRERLTKALRNVSGQIILAPHNLVDAIWENHPSLPAHSISIYPLSFAGISVADKITLVREHLATLLPHEGLSYIHPISALDAVAWLFNIRGSDVPFNPLALGYAVISPDLAVVYLNISMTSREVVAQLALEGVTVRSYGDFIPSLGEYQGHWIIDPQSTNAAIIEMVEKSDTGPIIKAPSPITLLKSVKNPVEIEGMRMAHLLDGAAFTSLLHWLNSRVSDTEITELSLAEKLEEFRSQNPAYRGPSFPTIAGFGPHGAIVHYSATPSCASSVTTSALLLIDSGGHYLHGTTDATRTIHLGDPIPEEAERYTLVLKGHLALSRAVFPAGTDGCDLDALARAPLWSHGLNYGHGTGHGVGCYLPVHEGPQRIALGRRSAPLLPGMVVSNEPGYYKPGAYGIRIENLLLVTERPDLASHELGEFLSFSPLTLVPYCRRLVVTSLLSEEERNQINAYHRSVRESLEPLLPCEVASWLQQETAPL